MSRGMCGAWIGCFLAAALGGVAHGAGEEAFEKTTPAAAALPAGALLRLGSPRFHQGYGVTSLVFLPDGQSVVAGGMDGGVRIMDLVTGSVRSVLREGKPEGGTYRKNCLALSPDGRILAFWEPNREKEVTLIAMPEGRALPPVPMGAPRGALCMRFSPDGKLLAVLDDHGFVVLRLEDQRVALEWTAPERLLSSFSSCLAFSPDSALLLVPSSEERAVAIWEIPARKEVLRYGEHPYLPSAAGFRPDGQAVTMDGKEIRVWRPRTGETSRVIPIGWCFVRELGLTPDGSTLVFLNNNEKNTRAFDTATGKELYTIPRRTADLSALALSPDGKRFVYGDESGALSLHETATGKSLLPQAPHDRPVLSLAFSPDGRWIATGGQDRRICLWDRSNGSARTVIEGSEWEVRALAFSHDARALASGDTQVARLWEVPAGRLLRTYGGYDSHTVTAVQFSADDKVLATGDGRGEVRAWNVSGGERLMHAPVLESEAGALAFSPSGSRIVAGLTRRYAGSDAVCLETATGKEVFRIHSPGDLGTTAVSDDGRRLAGVREAGAVRVWELCGTGADQIIAFQPHKAGLERMAFSPDGGFLASANGAGEVVVSEVASGKPVVQVSGLGTAVSSLRFSPEGTQFACGLSNGTALLWDWRKLLRQQDGPLPADVRGDVARLWELLESQDARRACHAALEMAAVGEEAVPFLKERVPPEKKARAAGRTLLAALDSEDFARREAATRELVALAAEFASVAALVRRLHEDKDASPEVRMRAGSVLKSLAGADARRPLLRRNRAVQVLGWIGSAAARKLLEELARDTTDRQSW